MNQHYATAPVSASLNRRRVSALRAARTDRQEGPGLLLSTHFWAAMLPCAGCWLGLGLWLLG